MKYLNVLKGEFKMEITFEKRYALVYALVLSVTNYVVTKINSLLTLDNKVMNIISIDFILFMMTLIFLSLFTREQKELVSLGMFYKKRPFEQVLKYIKNDSRIDASDVENLDLKNISNKVFFKKYYYPVRYNTLVKNKNAEFCIIRDVVCILFITVLVMLILTMIWHESFCIELIVSIVAYVIGVASCHRKARDFVCQIIVEYINKENK